MSLIAAGVSGSECSLATFSPTDPPTISTPLPSFTQEIEYGNPLTLSCSASGLDITWLWYHNGLQIIEALESTLVISGAVEEDSGIYQCFAYNPAGYDNSAALVTVNSEFHPNLSQNKDIDFTTYEYCSLVDNSAVLVSSIVGSIPSKFSLLAINIDFCFFSLP